MKMRNRGKRYLVTIAIVILFILIGGSLFYWLIGQKGSNQKFRTVKVERGEISSTVTATGTINPVITVLVGSQISGTIKALYADFNSRVKEGEVIAQIDPAIFESQVDQAKATVATEQANVANAQANLQNIQANLVKAEVSVSDAKKTLDRNLQLMKMTAIAQAALDTSQANYDSALAQREASKAQLNVGRSQIESAKAQLERARAALKMAETNLRYATIRSPVNGVVISRNVDVGQTVAASLQAPTLFTIAKDLTQMQVDTNFSEADIGRIENGQEGTFTVDAYPERTFRGRVSEIRNAPTIIQNVVTYDVVIQVDNKDLKLKPGMTANVSVMIAHKEGVLRISNAALRYRPEFAKAAINDGVVKEEQRSQRREASGERGMGGQKRENRQSELGEERKSARVWILSSAGQPVPVSIILGITDGTFSEVVSGDLKEGAELIVEEASNKKAQTTNTGRLPFMPGPRK
jgi:HlyD family secretion protein